MRQGDLLLTRIQTEAVFDQLMEKIRPELSLFSNCDLVVGIPFHDEQGQQLAEVLLSIDKVLKSWIGRRQLIVCVGDSTSVSALECIRDIKMDHPLLTFLLPEEINGRGSRIRSMIETSKILEADLIVFSANMQGDEGPGIEASWLENLLTPIQGTYDLVLGSLRRYYGIDSIAHMLAAPILESFYGCRIGDPLGGIYALAHDFIEELAHEAPFWGKCIQGYGIDFWLLTRALCWNKSICEVNMGGRVIPHSLQKRNQIFSETAWTVFESLKRDQAVWLRDRLVLRVADVLVRSEVKKPDSISYPLERLMENFRRGCQEYSRLLQGEEELKNLREICELSPQRFRLPDKVWVRALHELLLYYSFHPDGEEDNVFKLLTALYNGRVSSYLQEMSAFQENISALPEEELDELMVRKMESIRHRLTNEFWHRKPDFTREWLSRSEQSRPLIVPLGYMEYVPGKPVVIPKKIVGKDQRTVATDNIFRELRQRYENRFNSFIEEGIGLNPDASPGSMTMAVEAFMLKLEQVLEEILPGDLHTREGLQQFLSGIWSFFPAEKMFTISSELLREMVVRFPPVNLMIQLGYYRPQELIQRMDARDVVTWANLVESWTYTDRDLLWLVDNLKPESLDWNELKPVVITGDLRLGNLFQGKISNLNRVTARIAVRTLEKGKGGKYPRLRYFTSMLRRLAVAENYSQLFERNVKERKNIGTKIRNSLLGLQRGEEFSAHNIFENFHQRGLVERSWKLSEQLKNSGEGEKARLLQLMADAYGLAQVMENGAFLTCSAWSWASYSFKGGLKTPTPFTTSVENRWFNHEFLELLYQELGYNPAEIKEMVMRLIQSGRSSHNLLDTLLPARPRDVTVVIQEVTNEPSRQLRRFEGNPLLQPVEKNQWESKYVLNPGALRLGNHVYLFYRAVGEDDISHIGLAVTDGFRVLERLPQPVFSPGVPEEARGCEDPRLVVIEDRIFMLYTAYDGNIAQIAAASIATDEFLAGDYQAWNREGLAFTNIWDKDAILFPEKINGKYVIYHRIEPSIWVTYLDELKFPVREKHAIIAGPRPGRMWDSLKIGAGAQPLKTRYGWLLIYHGVDHNYVYRLGVILVDLHNPQKVLYRSPNPILEPEEDYEIGLDGAWVPNVVFTCGAVPGQAKELLDDEDEILVYYGAADTSIGLARATVADLIPQDFRITKKV